MADVLDLIKNDLEMLLQDDQVYFIYQKQLNTFNCVCNACCHFIFKEITSENFGTFKNILQCHLLSTIHVPQSVKTINEKNILDVNYHLEISFRKLAVWNKLSSYFTTQEYEKISKQVSVFFMSTYVMCLCCDFCNTEFIMHFNCNLLTSFIYHYMVNHYHPQILGMKKQLEIDLKNHRKKTLFMKSLKKLWRAQETGILNFHLSYYMENGNLSTKGKKTMEILINRMSSFNSKKYSPNKSTPKHIPKKSSKGIIKTNWDWCMIFPKNGLSHSKSTQRIPEKHLNKSKTNLQNQKNLSVLRNRKSDMESILNVMSSVSATLTNEQVYYIVNENHTIDCVCNICCCRIFENITRENFNLFKSRLKCHLLNVKHSEQLKLFIERENISDITFTSKYDLKEQFIDKICSYFSENYYSIKTKLDMQQLRNKVVLVSCDFCTKVYVMHVNCKLETSFVGHLKNFQAHQKDLKKICNNVSRPKQCYGLNEETFIEIFKYFPESLHDFSLKYYENGDVKIFCRICQRALPYNNDQPLNRISNLVYSHVKNSINHLDDDGCRENIKETTGSIWKFQYPNNFFPKVVVTNYYSSRSLLKIKEKEDRILRNSKIIEIEEWCANQLDVGGKVEKIKNKKNLQKRPKNFSNRKNRDKVKNKTDGKVENSEKKKCLEQFRDGKNEIGKFGRYKNIVQPPEVDFKTRCTSSISISKKLRNKLQHQQNVNEDSQEIFLTLKEQQRDDFNTATKLKTKRHLKKWQISKQLDKQDVMISEKFEGIRQRERTVLLLDLIPVKKRKYKFSALVNLEVSLMMEYAISRKKLNVTKKLQFIEEFPHIATPKSNRKELKEYMNDDWHMMKPSDDLQMMKPSDDLQMMKPSEDSEDGECNTVCKFVNGYLNKCFEKYFIDRGEYFTKIKFFDIVYKSNERNLLCLFCRHKLPFDFYLPLQDLSYLATLHLDDCLNNLHYTI